jgi:hypothetical protein
MERAIAIFVDGIGAAAATSGVLPQLQGRIFGLPYLQTWPMALEEIAAELDQSKSNISVNIRGLVDWHLVRRTHVADRPYRRPGRRRAAVRGDVHPLRPVERGTHLATVSAGRRLLMPGLLRQPVRALRHLAVKAIAT